MLWVKSFHIIAVVCWFAVLFYLPRLFVYHAMSQDKISQERFTVMERKLINSIGIPSMLATLFFGAWLSAYHWNYYQTSVWFWLKLGLVAILVMYHQACVYIERQFRTDRNTRSHVFYRWFNELPVLLLIAIVCLVVIQPDLS